MEKPNEPESYYGIIYCAYNKINGKRYIGQTTKTLHERRRKHYNQAGNDNVYFHKALAYYNVEDWEWTIIDYGKDAEDLNQKEIYWIDYYDTLDHDFGYNLTIGGRRLILTDESIRKMRETRLEHPSPNHYKQKVCRRVFKCLETGIIYPSSTEPAKICGVKTTNFLIAIDKFPLGEIIFYHNYHWQELDSPEKYKAWPNSIYCVELDRYYSSITQAWKEDNFSPNKLRQILSTGNPYEDKKYAGYTFHWVNPEKHDPNYKEE